MSRPSAAKTLEAWSGSYPWPSLAMDGQALPAQARVQAPTATPAPSMTAARTAVTALLRIRGVYHQRRMVLTSGAMGSI